MSCGTVFSRQPLIVYIATLYTKLSIDSVKRRKCSHTVRPTTRKRNAFSHKYTLLAARRVVREDHAREDGKRGPYQIRKREHYALRPPVKHVSWSRDLLVVGWTSLSPGLLPLLSHTPALDDADG